MLPVPSDLTDAIVVTLSTWAEESMQVETPAKAMGCIMRLSSALGYLLVRLAYTVTSATMRSGVS